MTAGMRSVMREINMLAGVAAITNVRISFPSACRAPDRIKVRTGCWTWIAPRRLRRWQSSFRQETKSQSPEGRRGKLRYPSDLTDEEWAHVAPLIPPAKRGGNKRTVDVREVLNGIMYVLSTGCQWRAVPKDLPARSTLYDYFDLWSWDGTLERIHHALYVKCREQEEREASPTAAIIDSQSVKSAEKGGRTIRMATTQERRSRARNAIFS
jgi:transposase